MKKKIVYLKSKNVVVISPIKVGVFPINLKNDFLIKIVMFIEKNFLVKIQSLLLKMENAAKKVKMLTFFLQTKNFSIKVKIFTINSIIVFL